MLRRCANGAKPHGANLNRDEQHGRWREDLGHSREVTETGRRGVAERVDAGTVLREVDVVGSIIRVEGGPEGLDRFVESIANGSGDRPSGELGVGDEERPEAPSVHHELQIAWTGRRAARRSAEHLVVGIGRRDEGQGLIVGGGDMNHDSADERALGVAHTAFGMKHRSIGRAHTHDFPGDRSMRTPSRSTSARSCDTGSPTDSARND